nr:MAG TPA: hypothetical protein [Caudoviricetes sp.]
MVVNVMTVMNVQVRTVIFAIVQNLLQRILMICTMSQEAEKNVILTR